MAMLVKLGRFHMTSDIQFTYIDDWDGVISRLDQCCSNSKSDDALAFQKKIILRNREYNLVVSCVTGRSKLS